MYSKIIGTITEYGENDVSVEFLSLPEEVSDKVMELIEPWCEASTRGTIRRVSEDMVDAWADEQEAAYEL